MPDPPSPAAETPSAPHPFLSLRMLLTLLAALLAFAGWQTYHRHYEAAHHALHGDHEEALSAQNDLLAQTSPNERLALLLRHADDSSYGLRYAAVDALSAYHEQAAADVVEKAFRDSASVVRIRALETLLDIAPERGLRLTLSGLRDEDTWMREAAISQIMARMDHQKKLMNHRLLPMLIRALDDRDTEVSFPAINALRKLTGNEWRYHRFDSRERKQAVVEQWKQWWTQNQSRYAIPAAYADPPALQPERKDDAPPFSLPDIDGKTIRLGGQQGRVTLLNFWGTWCGPCLAEMPDLIRLHEVYRTQPFDIAGIALNQTGGRPETTESLRRFCQQHGILYRQALATDAMIDDYGDIHEVPVSILLDKQGRVRYRWDSNREFETFSAAVQRLLKE